MTSDRELVGTSNKKIFIAGVILASSTNGGGDNLVGMREREVIGHSLKTIFKAVVITMISGISN